MQISEALLPCPFCGSGDNVLVRGVRYARVSSNSEAAVRCPTCECQGPLKSWNTRSAALAGHVLVPREPTPEMIQAAYDAEPLAEVSLASVYRAMIDAASQASRGE